MARTDVFTQRAEAYASWVRALRTAQPVPTLAPAPNDPLARLGDELALLTSTLARREQELTRLFDAVGSATAGVTLKEVLGRVFAGFKGLIPYDRIGCALVWDNGTTANAMWAQTELGAVQIDLGYSQPLAGSSLQQVMESGHPRILNDLPAYLAAKPDSDARVGGEEFLVLMHDVSAITALTETAEALRSVVADRPIRGKPGIRVTASFGAALALGSHSLQFRLSPTTTHSPRVFAVP